MPALFRRALAGTRFPWPVLLPWLLLGGLLASHRLLALAAGEPADDPASAQHPESRRALHKPRSGSIYGRGAISWGRLDADYSGVEGL